MICFYVNKAYLVTHVGCYDRVNVAKTLVKEAPQDHDKHLALCVSTILAELWSEECHCLGLINVENNCTEGCESCTT